MGFARNARRAVLWITSKPNRNTSNNNSGQAEGFSIRQHYFESVCCALVSRQKCWPVSGSV
jgi:hypothetical protein